MKIDQKGIDFLIEVEAARLNAYQDTKGIWTIGVGATRYQDGRRVKQGDKITKEQLNTLLHFHIKEAENDIAKLVKVPLTQNQFNALISFYHNVGITQFRSSTLLKKLNKADYVGASKEFIRWIKQPELKNRRVKETELFNS